MKKSAFVLGAAVVLTLAGSLWVFLSLGSWFQFSEEPQNSDVIVILGGDPSRAIKAAELYRQGWAPEIWIGRTYREVYFAHLDRIGIVLPKEEQIIKDALLKRGVPGEKMKFYGNEILSTLEEAQALRQVVRHGDARILLVTSLTHARRAKMIFTGVFPQAQIRAISDSQEPPQSRWWTRKFLAEKVVKEALCTAYLKLGGKILNHRP